MVEIFRDDHVREEALAGERFLDRLRRCRRLDDTLVTARAGVFESRGFDHAETGRHILELFRGRVADASLDLAARADLLGVGDVNLDALARKLRRQPSAACGARAPARPAGSLARIHFDGLGHRAWFIRELRKREPQLIGADPFRLLAEEPLT